MEHIDLPDVKTKRGLVRVKSNLSKIVIEMDPRTPTTPKLYIKSARLLCCPWSSGVLTAVWLQAV